MTTIKQILDQFDAGIRYSDKVENINIGKHTFNEAHMDETLYLMEFTNTENLDVWLRINDDRVDVLLYERLDKNRIKLTSWRGGITRSIIFDNTREQDKAPYKNSLPYPKSKQEIFITEEIYKQRYKH